jgi:threonine dehydrogenase-like Zn-dependent dehydrogenase
VSKIEEYRKLSKTLPGQYLAWQVYGAGFDNLGKNGRPEALPLRPPRSNEILLRVDALGLCLSDIKIINQGKAHPRLRGRDLANDPTVLGHECAVTVVQVGEQWRKNFTPGDRFIVQADIYYKGLGFAFGYLIPGGMEQYCYLDERALAGDEGCYLLPVKPETGYSESALAEPWACVEMSYCLDDRVIPGEGTALVVADDLAPWRSLLPSAQFVGSDLRGLPEEGTFDDIIIVTPTVDVVQKLSARLGKNGVMFLLGTCVGGGTVSLDIGRIHYDNIRFYGGGDNLAQLAKFNARHDLQEGGAALFIGAGGPMGQMHVQRAIEKKDGPSLVVVTDLDRGRLDHIVDRFGAMAKDRGVRLITLAPEQFASTAAMNEAVQSYAPKGYDDVVVLAPVPAIVEQGIRFAADNALVNVFAGLGIGSFGNIGLADLCRGIKIIGSSGSRISDLRKVLSMVEAKALNTNLSVAAIGGLKAAREGLENVKAAKFPGKTVIYPQIPDLPLTDIRDIPAKLPELADKLTAQGAWTKAAEEALLERYL